MEKHDVFLFGSRFDDWGYVLIEAMGRGLCVVAPDISPFDEIVGKTGVTYPLDSSQIFKMKVDELCQMKLTLKKTQALERADSLFSRDAFSKELIKVFKESVVL
jgi:glycosyltransferase involved in cell wall biosynthesis